MIINIGIATSFLIGLLIIIIVFYSKPKIDIIENKYFKKLIIITIFGLILEDIIYIFVILMPFLESIFYNILIKTLYVYYCLWMYYFVLYSFVIFFQIKDVNNSLYKKFKIFMKIFYSIAILLSIIFPITLTINDNYIYPFGIGTNIQYIIFTLGMNIIGFSVVKNYKILKQKESIPIVACIILGIVSSVIQFFYHQFLLIVPSHAIAIVLMYHTIENPDIKMIKELNIARDQAEKANNAKTEFLSNMSHEIRTPLNAIVGFSQALSEEDIPPSAKEEVKDIIMASDSLLELVNGILDISKIEAGKLEIVNTEYNFKKIWDELILLTKARMGEKALDFRYIYDESIPNILYGDYARLKQIILNLLTNAVKYTKEGYIEMKVNSFKKDDICRLIISVEDSGIGIKQENISKLFQKFERFDLENNITIEGTGLGLAITKRLIELMNGQIVVQSIYGKGSKFIISIDQRIVKKEIIEKDVDLKEKSLKNFNGEGIKILVVDDNKINLKVAQRLLQNYNLEVTLCESGFECLEKINNKENYSLILMDDMMPKMNGKETFNKLKEIPNFSTPVIALTANAISGMKEQYLKLGFSDYLAKPIERSELDRVINKFLNK